MRLSLAYFVIAYRRFCLRRSISKYRRQPGVRQSIQLAKALLRLGRTRDALEITGTARRQFGESPRLHKLHDRARTLHARHLLGQAIRALRAEGSCESYIRVIDVSRILGDFDRAFKYSEEAMARFPDQWAVHACIGRLHYYHSTATQNIQGYQNVLDSLGRALELNPEHYGTQLLLAITAIRLGEVDQARTVLEQMLARSPDDRRTLQLWAYCSQLDASRLPPPVAQPAGGPTAKDAHEGAGAVRAAPPSTAPENLLGLFVFDESSEVLQRYFRPNSHFDFDAHPQAVLSLLDTCQVDSDRIGIGQLESWTATGAQWQITLDIREGKQVLGFFEGQADPEELRRGYVALLEGSVAT